jgi:hypothetical protein
VRSGAVRADAGFLPCDSPTTPPATPSSPGRRRGGGVRGRPARWRRRRAAFNPLVDLPLGLIYLLYRFVGRRHGKMFFATDARRLRTLRAQCPGGRWRCATPPALELLCRAASAAPAPPGRGDRGVGWPLAASLVFTFVGERPVRLVLGRTGRRSS